MGLFNEKTRKKLKEKRFYIVLACCALSIGAIAFTNSIKKEENLPTENKNSDVRYSLPEPIENTQETKIAEDDDIIPLPPIEDDDEILPEAAPEVTEEEEDELFIAPPVTEQASSSNTQNSLAKIASPSTGKILAPYSKNPIYSELMGDWRSHEAIDYEVEEDTAVYAAASGKIIDISDSGLYGASITIDHQNSMKTVYSNVAAENISVGDFVEEGDAIGRAENTSLCERYGENHIHFEVMIDDKNVDPNEWLK